MSLRHSIKRALRVAYARFVWHTRLFVLIDRRTPRRLTILYGHCIDDPAVNGELAPVMRIREERLERALEVLGQHFELVTVAEGMDRLASEGGGRSLVALSMDDGYRDNLSRLAPLLARTGARATVFLEAGPVLERKLGWLHAFEWLVAHLGAEPVATAYAALSRADAKGRAALAAANDDPQRMKRALKYDADPVVRDAALRSMLESAGGDAAALVDRLYLDAAGAAELAGSGRVELGGHTVEHPVLATLAPERQQGEIARGRAALEERFGAASGVTFAYPFGRAWDFDAASVEAARSAGYRYAVTTHAGTNRRGADPYRLRRWPIDDSTPLEVLVAEASGAFELLRRLGIDLVE